MAQIYVEFEDGVSNIYSGIDFDDAICKAIRDADENETRVTYYTDVLDEAEEEPKEEDEEEPKGEAEDRFTVYLESESGITSYPFMTFETEKGAHDFCEENDWVWIDENEYEWKLVYYHD